MESMCRDDYWHQLSSTIAARSAEDQNLWRSLAIFWAANAVLLVALFKNGTWPTDRSVVLVLGLFGLVMAVLWYIVQSRILQHLAAVEEVMSRLEALLKLDQITPGIALSFKTRN